jgi:hypothetical protein
MAVHGLPGEGRPPPPPEEPAVVLSGVLEFVGRSWAGHSLYLCFRLAGGPRAGGSVTVEALNAAPFTVGGRRVAVPRDVAGDRLRGRAVEVEVRRGWASRVTVGDRPEAADTPDVR